jgi:putative nucleotidyltransferase with HDIG domain
MNISTTGTNPHPLQVIIVEDNPSDAELMILQLEKEGFLFEWKRVETEEEYFSLLDGNCDLILSDWSLPQFSGLRALEILNIKGKDIPFIIISGSIGEEAAIQALHLGAYDYLLKDHTKRLGKAVMNALDQKRLNDEKKTTEEALRKLSYELIEAYEATLEGWSNTLEMREHETAGHSKRVVQKTIKLAQAYGMSQEEIIHIRRGALLHDIGKMGIPDSILLKPGPLDDQEWNIMRQHPVNAYKLLSKIQFLVPALDIPYHHHERWNGEGYPLGLKGSEIPLAARIFAIVDVWDALSHDRPYRKAWPEKQVIEHLKEQSGKHFDPKVVEIFLDMI